MLAFVFPGQGSQRRGMGRGMFDEVEEFASIEREADRCVGYSLRQLCLEDPDNLLSDTRYTQPSIYVVNALYYYKARARGEQPGFLAGHSVGEYNALLAAGAFDLLTGLHLIQARAQLMGSIKEGGMAAVVGLKADEVAKLIHDRGLGEVDIGAYNSPVQTVISGPTSALKSALPMFEKAGAKLCIPLPVSAAFHSRYMTEASKAFKEVLDKSVVDPLRSVVIANVTGQPYPADNVTAIKALLVRQMTEAVRWTDTVHYLLNAGATCFREIGPGAVLTKLLEEVQKCRQNDGPKSRTISTIEPPNETSRSVLVGQRKQENSIPYARPTETPNSGYTRAPKRAPDVHDSIAAGSLGSHEFRAEYHLKYAYLAGAMYKGISSKEMVVAMGRAGLMSYLGIGGLRFEEVESAIRYIQRELAKGEPYGVNLLCNLERPELEEQTVEVLFKYGIKRVEAAAFMQVTPSLVRYRLRGIKRGQGSAIVVPHRVIAKVSRPEVAAAFMQPAPEAIVRRLVGSGILTGAEAELSQSVPMCSEICVEADSGGHTDGGVAYALMPVMLKLRDEFMARYRYRDVIWVGAAGGIGTPQAAAAAFIMGAEFILTGSINQCTVEAGTSDRVKDMLQEINIQDTDYAPAGDMFELGAKVQVVRKGLFFPARANKLYELYQRHESIDDLDERTKMQIQEKYFGRSFEAVWEETEAYYKLANPRRISEIDKYPKQKMALIFRWYFIHTVRLAMKGSTEQQVDYQIHCGPALGAFNQWVKGTELESWRNRHVAEIGESLMCATARLLNSRLAMFAAVSQSSTSMATSTA